MEEHRPEIGDYYVLDSLGSGSYGKVKLAENKFTGEKVAIKIVKKSTIESQPGMASKIQREISLMRLLDHPHLLKLIDVCESPRHLYIILEYAAHGELFDFLVDKGNLSVELAIHLFRQIIYGLEFLHSHSICHRDIKPENILLDEHNNVKIADFGFACWMKDNTAVTACGSPHYTAPEIIVGLPYDGRASDIWSCGVVFYTLMCGRLPFDEPTVRKLLAKVKSGKFIMPEFPPEIKDLIQRMLTVDPKKRITLSEIKQHPAFRIGLPHLYTCPTPQPIPSDLPAVDPSKLPEQAVLVLHQLGFDDETLEAELQTPEHTDAKEFCYLMEGKISFDSLKWDSISSEEDKPLMMPGEYETEVQTSPTRSLSRDSLQGSQSCYSVVERSILGFDVPSIQGIDKKTYETKAETEIVMNAIQEHLTGLHYSWVFPDDFKVFTRGSGNDIVITIRPIEDSLQNIDVLLFNGSTDTFDEFCEAFASMIESIVQ